MMIISKNIDVALQSYYGCFIHEDINNPRDCWVCLSWVAFKVYDDPIKDDALWAFSK